MGDSHGEQVRPATLDEALEAIDRILPEETKAQLLLRPEATLNHEHWGLGHWVRNTFSLWDSDAPLTRWFGARGFFDADAMSGELVRAYWRHLHGIPQNPLPEHPNHSYGLDAPPTGEPQDNS